MTFQARQFLGDIGAVGEEGNFFEQTFVVTGNRQTRPFECDRGAMHGIF